jgi:glycosyltransferase involved in cell wall biosynthesis
MSLSFVFVEPVAAEALASPTAYNAALRTALRALGSRVTSSATAPAVTDAGIAIIDTLASPVFTDIPPPARSVLLAHHAAPFGVRPTRSLLDHVAGVITPSALTAERLRSEYGIAEARIRIVPPGIAELPRSAGSGGDGCHILSIGGLARRKGHDVLLQALALLPDLDWHLTIIGSATRQPETAASLAALAASLGIAGRVRFLGTVSETEYDRIWRETDLFALASRFEAYGAATAEALRRGVPVALTAGGANAELVPPEAGVIAPVDDAQGLSKAMRRLIFSRPLRQDFGAQAAIAGAALPDWPTQAQLFVSSVAALLQER